MPARNCAGSKTGLHDFLTTIEMEPYHAAMATGARTPPVACPECGRKVSTYRSDAGCFVGVHEPPCRACAVPPRSRTHTCGLSTLQDLMRF